ncbi:MAG: topoisomerase IV [Clostridia bacterium]|nr:topoisomerase IV [Clostridia bacterium]
MAEKKTNKNTDKKHADALIPAFVPDKPLFREETITATLEENYMPYAMSVIVSRAIPEIDGFKPSHRKLLYTMYKKGLLKGPRTKSANVVGETMKLNPHGDQAIYDTMVRMTRGNQALLHPFVDSKGNFGKQYSRDMQCAAPRYTEVKLDRICEELFADMDRDAVDFVDNYDGTMKEPTLFPVTFPTILVNSTQGLAVGMATNICSFNLKEVCEAACAFIDNKDCDLAEYIQAPDFSTGGTVIYSQSVMRQILEEGRGSVKIRAKYRFDKKNNCIEIYEIPYTTVCEAIMDDVVKLVKDGKIKEIVDVRDETDLGGLKITLDVRKNIDPDALMNKLYKMTSLQENFACNFNVLIDGRPQVLGVRGLLSEWLRFRLECVKREIRFDIKTKSDKLHLLKGLEKILLDIDKAIKIVRETEKDDLVIPNLMWGFGIDEIQANFVADIKLRNLNKEYILEKTGDIAQLIEEINDLKDMLDKEHRIRTLIKRQLRDVEKKYGKERLTDIIHEDDVVTVTNEELIEDYNLKLFLTRDGYFKKIPMIALRNNPEQKLKEGDVFSQEIEWHNKSEVLFFSDKQSVYKLKIHELPDCKAGSLGDYLSNTLELSQDERIIYMCATDNYAGDVLFAFENGKIARVPLESYATKNNRRKLINAYSGVVPVAGILHISVPTDIVCATSNDRLITLNSDLVPLKTTKTTQGVQVLKPKKDYKLKYMKRADMCTELADPNAYRIRAIPSPGSFLKKDDQKNQQLSLLD